MALNVHGITLYKMNIQYEFCTKWHYYSTSYSYIRYNIFLQYYYRTWSNVGLGFEPAALHSTTEWSQAPQRTGSLSIRIYMSVGVYTKPAMGLCFLGGWGSTSQWYSRLWETLHFILSLFSICVRWGITWSGPGILSGWCAARAISACSSPWTRTWTLTCSMRRPLTSTTMTAWPTSRSRYVWPFVSPAWLVCPCHFHFPLPFLFPLFHGFLFLLRCILLTISLSSLNLTP